MSNQTKLYQGPKNQLMHYKVAYIKQHRDFMEACYLQRHFILNQMKFSAGIMLQQYSGGYTNEFFKIYRNLGQQKCTKISYTFLVHFMHCSRLTSNLSMMNCIELSLNLKTKGFTFLPKKSPCKKKRVHMRKIYSAEVCIR